ncbi:peptidoglycan-binding domain-containing protein [Paracoccus sp. Z330]|uniref:Peptidoglycan-binding domain-containing protein n=1 Tax=Paracoccus onchidii TaxID=3017813 RepID=A0ABT4ZHC9_9RHOB|nr:peptidoglycan-binding domain-containing protein [Paracoccus onchidii]MDB6178502.1 peptidoglycan-binding domain-containing protein [Paracoccus onchidii]
MRRLAWIVMAAGLPATGFAQDAVIRIEAKRGDSAVTEAATNWSSQFDEVVTFSLPRGWTAIGLGPFAQKDAEDRLQELKAAGQIPQDSFVAVPGRDTILTPFGDGNTDRDIQTDDGQAATPVTEALSGSYIRLQSVQTEAEARAALEEWRKTFPAAGIWALDNSWYSVTLGPASADVAAAWLTAFKAGGAAPNDAFISDAADLGTVLVEGRDPDLSLGDRAELPPLDQVQRVLRWAGRYDGDIDGQTGPKTREAIARAVSELRFSPDAGATIKELMRQRDEWRKDLGLAELRDAATGLALIAPLEKLSFDRSERALSIYKPKNGSGAALILFSQQGGQQELLDLSGLVTALGWVPRPERDIENGHILLRGANEDHISIAEGWVRDGRAEGFVLIWPAADAENQPRIAREISDSIARHAPGENESPQAAATTGLAP